jgi:two-component system cell cycle sensor histidine kinase/response regulator CckA
MLSRVIGEDVRLETSSAADLRMTRADRGQLEQVLMNLVVNARDAMPMGGVIRIGTANADLDEAFARRHDGAVPGRYVSMTVEDSGCGMAPDVLARAFEPFFTTKGPGKGTGLGLATVYGIVHQSGGYVTISSTPGVGTSIAAYFPAVDERVSGRAADAAPRSLAGTETILVAEDEPGVRDLIRRSLAPHGYKLLEAANGLEALEVAERFAGEIDLLLTDIVMPEMNGPNLAQRLLFTRRDLKVLYVSGFPMTAVTRSGSISSRAQFLAKPFSSATLAAAVRKSLDAVSAPRMSS